MSSNALTAEPGKAAKPSKPPRPLRPTKRSDHEFLAPALEILETPPSPVRMALILIICAFVVTALTWAYIGRIDIIAAAQGKLQPTGRVKVVQPLVTGKVKLPPPANGTHVEAGDVLLELDPTEALADEDDVAASLASLKVEMARRRVAIEAARSQSLTPLPAIAWPADVPPALRDREERILAGDLGQLTATLASLAAQRRQKEIERDRLGDTIAAQRSLLQTLQERVTMRSHLVDKQAGTIASVIDATETLKTQTTQLAVQQQQLADAEAGMVVFSREAEKTLGAFVSDNSQKLGDAERQVEGFEQKVAKARDLREQMTLKSPIAGTVQASAITNPGQVVTVGQEVMRIVPDGSALELEVYVLNKDIGFVKVGQQAVVKIESFPFTRYGTINAHVVRVATDAIPEPDASQREGNPAAPLNSSGFAGAERTQNLVFAVMLKPDETSILADGRRVPLSPGMAVTTEIKTGSRRILEYVFSPLVETAEEALHER